MDGQPDDDRPSDNRKNLPHGFDETEFEPIDEPNKMESDDLGLDLPSLEETEELDDFEEEEPQPLEPGERLVSLDAYRGFIMLLLASGGLALTAVADRFADSGIWQFIGRQFGHAEWQGCAFWDLVQPSFMFMVGVAMPFSFAKRRAEGHSFRGLSGHVLKRSIVLVLLGIFLMSNGESHTNFTFVNVLSQIGLAYLFASLLVGRGPMLQIIAVLAVLGGYWYAFYQHPIPTAAYDFAGVGVPPTWDHFNGLFAHFEKNANFAHDFDLWFLNLLPQAQEFTHNAGGYQTLNFVPSIATLIIGIMAGQLLRGPSAPRTKLRRLVKGALVCVLVGLALNFTVCPIIKRIWTPAWTIFAGGLTMLLLAAFYGIIDVKGWRKWSFPLVVVGMNPLTIFVMANLSKRWIAGSLRTHLTPWAGQVMDKTGEAGEISLFSNSYALGPLYDSLCVLFAMWLFLYWMYRRKIFVRI